MNANPAARTIELARAAGFDLCGIAPAAEFPELGHLEEWLERGYAGEMRYLHDARRHSPAQAMQGARSVIVCALNYNSAFPASTEAWKQAEENGGPRGWISRYAWGDDYHFVLGEKLDLLIDNLRGEFRESFEARAYVDTGPIVERVAAKYAGLGWLAKNTCLINEELGSWLFLGVVLTTFELAPTLPRGEPPPADLCGNCTLCLEACPTQAFAAPYVLDARRCISYLTIELRGAIPGELREGIGGAVFGCDICQDVCPWNRKAAVTGAAEFAPREIADVRSSKFESRDSEPAAQSADLATGDARDGDASPREPNRESKASLLAPELGLLAGLSQQEFSAAFRESAVKRTKWRGMVRNACVALGNASFERDSPARSRAIAMLDTLARSEDDLIAEHATWALGKLGAAE